MEWKAHTFPVRHESGFVDGEYAGLCILQGPPGNARWHAAAIGAALTSFGSRTAARTQVVAAFMERKEGLVHHGGAEDTEFGRGGD